MTAIGDTHAQRRDAEQARFMSGAVPDRAIAQDRVWAEINALPKRGKGWGASSNPRVSTKIETPALITEPTKRLTMKALRSPPCTTCGNRSPTHCSCEEIEREGTKE